jgi:hypothetical protein
MNAGSLLSVMEVYCPRWKFTVCDGSLLSAGKYMHAQITCTKKNIFFDEKNIDNHRYFIYCLISLVCDVQI